MVNMVLRRIQQVVMTHVTTHSKASYRQRLYERMHGQNSFCGLEWKRHVSVLQDLIPNLKERKMLDFGCGPSGGLAALFGGVVTAYDPYIKKYNRLPLNHPFDVVFSSDVLEHMTQKEVNQFLGMVEQISPEFIFLNISTRRAQLILPNGANAHLTVCSVHWWHMRLRSYFGTRYEMIFDRFDCQRKEIAVCFRKGSK